MRDPASDASHAKDELEVEEGAWGYDNERIQLGYLKTLAFSQYKAVICSLLH